MEIPAAAVETQVIAALAGLKANTLRLYDYDAPVLIEGGMYRGIWMEGGPHQSLLYAEFDREVARHGHEIFFHHQRADGYIPCAIFPDRVIKGQIQAVVPIARTSWELAGILGDESFLARAYDSCARYDRWLFENRNTRGTGCLEIFCEYDTGHDRSPRVEGLPRQCPDEDPSRCPDIPGLPYLAPDLSAMAYGGRLALAAMGRALGRDAEAESWEDKAAELRGAIMRHCFDPEDCFFYDVDAGGNFRRIRGDIITRVLCEQVVDQPLFEEIYARHIHDESVFWTPVPLPSISPADPQFRCTIEINAWDGPSMALTALRAPRWFEHYGKTDDLHDYMHRWVEVIVRSGGFYQQAHPFEGYMRVSKDYSPAMFVLLDFARRLGLR